VRGRLLAGERKAGGDRGGGSREGGGGERKTGEGGTSEVDRAARRPLPRLAYCCSTGSASVGLSRRLGEQTATAPGWNAISRATAGRRGRRYGCGGTRTNLPADLACRGMDGDLYSLAVAVAAQKTKRPRQLAPQWQKGCDFVHAVVPLVIAATGGEKKVFLFFLFFSFFFNFISALFTCTCTGESQQRAVSLRSRAQAGAAGADLHRRHGQAES